jgi:hypothetical protein
MPLKVFISSEMGTSDDKERRKAARAAIEDKTGHIVYCFEKLPGRPLQDDQNPVGKCLQMVRESDILIGIIDDTVSSVMIKELKEAVAALGQKRIFYYFTANGARDDKAKALWKHAKKGYIIKEFETSEELGDQIIQSLASYIEGALSETRPITQTLIDEETKIRSEEEKEWELEDLKKGDILTITCKGNENFYAGVFQREEFINKRSAGIGGAFNFPFGSDRPQFTKKLTIIEDDDYFLIIRVGYFSGTARIDIKVKCRRS